MGVETLLGIPIGIGLSAACGFRVFVPLFVMNLASLTGHLHFGPGFEWIGTTHATVAFGTATLLEVLAYTIPWLDHILDMITSPVAVVARTIATARQLSNLRSPISPPWPQPKALKPTGRGKAAFAPCKVTMWISLNR
ncbi:MAG: DUF4126 domain-containing protein [Thermodesulfobacteriota bacterium]